MVPQQQLINSARTFLTLYVSLFITLHKIFIRENFLQLFDVSPLVILYCLVDSLDTKLKLDKRIHHLSTISLNCVLYFAYIHHDTLKTSENYEEIYNLTSAFFDTEVSTIFLTLLSLERYKSNKILKFFFVTSFVYFRIISLTYCYVSYGLYKINDVCQDFVSCYIYYFFGTLPLIILNFYWLYKIICIFLKKSHKEKND